jgi:23S rRNA (cytosine1962-C5)-methyltransferase
MLSGMSIAAILKQGREKPVQAGHPWIFSGAVAAWNGSPGPGSCVEVFAHDRTWVGRGLANPQGSLAIRVYTRDEAQALETSYFAAKLDAAIAWREQVVLPAEPDTDSFRLCFSESDGLSGLVVDRYADHASLHLNTSLLLPHLPAFRDVLTARGLTTTVQIDSDSFAKEGGAAPPAMSDTTPSRRITIRESGFSYEVDPAAGQKTGFYLDQRVNRRRVAAYARDRRCLSAYCYTGGFETNLARAGAASITGLDRSEPAIAQARINQSLNPGGTPVDYLVADVPEQLRSYRDHRTTFDLIVLDPPKFVHNQGQIEKGLRAYKDINRLAMKLLTPGGILATFSCSGWVKTGEFLKAIGWAAEDAGRDIQILEHLTQPPDHPVLLSFPESDYLCGLILRVV